jgi:hypothetical protein
VIMTEIGVSFSWIVWITTPAMLPKRVDINDSEILQMSEKGPPLSNFKQKRSPS